MKDNLSATGDLRVVQYICGRGVLSVANGCLSGYIVVVIAIGVDGGDDFKRSMAAGWKEEGAFWVWRRKRKRENQSKAKRTLAKQRPNNSTTRNVKQTPTSLRMSWTCSFSQPLSAFLLWVSTLLPPATAQNLSRNRLTLTQPQVHIGPSLLCSRQRRVATWNDNGVVHSASLTSLRADSRSPRLALSP